MVFYFEMISAILYLQGKSFFISNGDCQENLKKPSSLFIELVEKVHNPSMTVKSYSHTKMRNFHVQVGNSMVENIFQYLPIHKNKRFSEVNY